MAPLDGTMNPPHPRLARFAAPGCLHAEAHRDGDAPERARGLTPFFDGFLEPSRRT